ncbi:thiol-activated cytolysin family protein [Streptomyces longisporus]|uniref:Thiol-activated cytolysin n=1 Tax=Streptomyces longisporus TaxID=1948 RepID=A0ABN3NJU4_STRLO
MTSGPDERGTHRKHALSEQTELAPYRLLDDGEVGLSWWLVPGADRYEVTALDGDGAATPLGITEDITFVIPPESVNGATSYRVVAVSGGEEITQLEISPSPMAPDSEPADMNAYVKQLAGWRSIAPHDPDKIEPHGPEAKSTEKAESGYVVTKTQRYDMTKTPEIIMTRDPNADILWPGALVQGAAAVEGGLTECAIKERKPIRIGITSLGGNIKSQLVENPSGSLVGDAIRAMTGDRDATPETTFYRMSEASSARSALLEMNASASYMGFKSEASGEFKKEDKSTTIYALFIQRAFTVTCDNNGLPDQWFTPALTNKRLSEYQPQYIDQGNPPLWISGVSYGRSLIFAFHSNSSTLDAKAALRMGYDGGAFSGSAELKAKLQQILDTSEVSIIARGGPNKDIMALIRDNSLKSYFSGDLKMNQCVPISYTLKSLADASIASMSETTQFTKVSRSPLAFTFQLDATSFEGRTIALGMEIGIRGNLKKTWTRDFGSNPFENGFEEQLDISGHKLTVRVPVNPEMFRQRRTINSKSYCEQPDIALSGDVSYTLTMLQPSGDDWPMV